MYPRTDKSAFGRCVFRDLDHMPRTPQGSDRVRDHVVIREFAHPEGSNTRPHGLPKSQAEGLASEWEAYHWEALEKLLA
jgi:hypothetical protein